MMRAVIMAGGKGTRLAPFTVSLPKPLMSIGGMPILEIIIRQLGRAGVSRITLAVGYLSNMLEDFFGKGDRYGVSIDYSREEEPLGTVGSLALVDGLGSTFLVMNGDVLTTLDYASLVEYHRRSGALVTIAMHERSVQINLGVIEAGDDNVLTGYVERPTYRYRASMGVYVFEPRVLNYIRPGSRLDFPELIWTLLDAGERVVAYPFDGHWLDIGSPEDFALAGELFNNFRREFLPEE